MKTLGRINLHVSPRQEKWLRAEAKRLGITVAEVLRRIIDAHLEGKAA